ncbi:MAG TPA: LysR family transcriptional regulator [Aquabacterium sp.]|nr:LysR family transcriptional regulator [Aquabacterium sp.]
MDRLHSMQVFCRVIDCRGFAAAARDLDLSPSVVTRLVADLEAHLGVRLLNRTTRRLVLTDAGEQYLEQVRRILRDIEDAEAAARTAATTLRGHLKVLASPAFSAHQLARDLVGFRQRYPGVTVSVSAPGMVETLDERYDLSLITTGEEPLDGMFVARRLACSKVILCASPAYLAEHGRPVDPEALMAGRHEWVVPESVRDVPMRRDDQSRDQVGTLILSVSSQQSPLSTAHMDTAYAAALAGLGVAVLPSYIVADALADGRLERVLPGWYFFNVMVYAAMPSRKHVPARTRAFLDYLLERYPGGDEDPWLPPSPAR